MIRRTIRFFCLLIIAIASVNVLIAVLTNVSTDPTGQDDAFFRTELGLIKSQAPTSYEQEIALIRSLQVLVLNEVAGVDPIPQKKNRNPEHLFKAKSGSCYDRSRAMEMLFRWRGFETRHLYLLYADDKETGERVPFWLAAITKKTGSHAVTEVKTSRGWLVVDSIRPWISVAIDGAPVGHSSLYLKANRFESIPEYLQRPFWAVPGLYSRHGQFYPPFTPYPELNWLNFISWLVAD